MKKNTKSVITIESAYVSSSSSASSPDCMYVCMSMCGSLALALAVCARYKISQTTNIVTVKGFKKVKKAITTQTGRRLTSSLQSLVQLKISLWWEEV